MANLIIVLGQDFPNGRWNAATIADAEGIAMSGWGDTPAEALAALAQDMARTPISFVNVLQTPMKEQLATVDDRGL